LQSGAAGARVCRRRLLAPIPAAKLARDRARDARSLRTTAARMVLCARLRDADVGRGLGDLPRWRHGRSPPYRAVL